MEVGFLTPGREVQKVYGVDEGIYLWKLEQMRKRCSKLKLSSRVKVHHL